PDQVKPTFKTKSPSLNLSTPPPAQCTMNASKMMARITTTTPEEEPDNAGDGIPGDRCRSSHGHQLPAAAQAGRGQRRPPCPPAPARLVRRSVRHRQHGSNHNKKPEAMHGRVLLPPDPLDAAPGATGTEEPQPPRPRNRHHRGGAGLS